METKDITLRDIDNMSAAQYQSRLSDPEFRKHVNELTKVVPVDAALVDAAPVEVIVPVTEVPAATAPTQKEYRYQPTDEHGRKLGGEQVIRYSTDQELAEKLRDQNVLLVRKLREVTRKNFLNIPEEQTTLAKFEGPIELTETPLTAEERFQIGQDLQDPTKFNEGRDRLLESAFGVKPEVLRNRLNSMGQTQVQQGALNNYTSFLFETPDYNRSPENDQTLTAYMVKNELPPTVEGFKYAHSKVKAAGLLLDPPPVQEVTVQPPALPAPVAPVAQNSQSPVVSETRIGQNEQPQTKRQVPVPSGLNDRVSSSSTPRSEGITVTLADIDKMPSAEYKQRVKDPAFRALVNKLELEKNQRMAAKVSQ